MPPSKLAHVVFQTNRIGPMRDWYCRVLGGQVIYENAHLSFVTYDDEHHRVAFVDFGPLTPRDANPELMVKSSEPPGLHHVAFTFGSMDEFLDNYAAFSLNPNFATALMADGLHPNDAGYVVLGQSFYTAIAPVLPAGP